MRDSNATAEMGIDRRVNVSEGRLSDNVFGTDAVNADVERREIVARIDERLVLEDFNAVAKPDDADLADAADA